MTTPIPPDGEKAPTLTAVTAALWHSRLRLLLWIGGGATVTVGLLAVVFFLRPTQLQAELEFRLLFTGAERGLYPNETRFAPSDIVAAPVLREVYERNHLENVLKYEDFATAFAVLPRNPALSEFRREFRARLEDTGLTQIERAKVEDEYESRGRALRSGRFVLVGRLSGGWPAKLKPELLAEILKVWAERARVQGAFLFNFDIYSGNILADVSVENDDYLVLLDRIRVTINRVLGNLDQLESIPGASMVRAGSRQLSVGELKALLRDGLQYKLSQVRAPVFSMALYRNQAVSEAYICEQLSRLQRESAFSKTLAEGVEAALAGYSSGGGFSMTSAGAESSSIGPAAGGGLMPQLSESFINRLLDMSSIQSDVSFRQDLARQSIQHRTHLATLENERQIYDNMLRQLAVRSAGEAEKRTAMQDWVGSQTAALIVMLKESLTTAQLLFAEISRRNLDPVQVYAVDEGIGLKRVSPIGLGRLMGLLVIVGAAYACVVLLFIAHRPFVARD